MSKKFVLQEYVKPSPPLAAAEIFADSWGDMPLIPAYLKAYESARGTIEAEAWARAAARERCETLEDIVCKGKMLCDFLPDLKEKSLIGVANTAQIIARSIVRDAVLLGSQPQ